MTKIDKHGRSRGSTRKVSSTKDEWFNNQFPFLLVSALLALLRKHDIFLFERVELWLNDLVAEYFRVSALKGIEEASKAIEKALTNPILLDRRKKKQQKGDTKLIGEYNLIIQTISTLPRKLARSRHDLICKALRRKFPEVDSSDFVPSPSASETAYWILASRYTNNKLESIVTRLNRARKQLRDKTEKDYSELGIQRTRGGTPRSDELQAVLIEYLRRALPNATKDEKRMFKKVIDLIEKGYAEVYGKKLEEL